MTLDELLDLIAMARRSPHARRVLHDALLERYTRDYEHFLWRARVCADRAQRPCVVMVSAEVLEEVELRWAELYPTSPFGPPLNWLENFNVFRVYDLKDLAQNQNRVLTETLVTTVYPPGPPEPVAR